MVYIKKPPKYTGRFSFCGWILLKFIEDSEFFYDKMTLACG